MDGGAYLSEARSWSDTPLCAAAGGQDMDTGLGGGARWRRGITSYNTIISRVYLKALSSPLLLEITED